MKAINKHLDHRIDVDGGLEKIMNLAERVHKLEFRNSEDNCVNFWQQHIQKVVIPSNGSSEKNSRILETVLHDWTRLASKQKLVESLLEAQASSPVQQVIINVKQTIQQRSETQHNSAITVVCSSSNPLLHYASTEIYFMLVTV